MQDRSADGILVGMKPSGKAKRMIFKRRERRFVLLPDNPWSLRLASSILPQLQR